jgi:hypothetical protein
MTEPIVFVYRGEDRFYGVPRRSLTQADFDALTLQQQRDVLASSSYVPRKADTAPSSKPAAKADTGKEG